MTLSPEAECIFEEARRRSEDGLKQMRDTAEEMFEGDDSIIIGVNGSYARREATGDSVVPKNNHA
ncbi:MAG: hypothetical protein GDA39_05735 [Hyphomonadaceae bacterium]|nr:hypothetical protein [Hyphomonadaceae bacterium]MBC6412406.1 hypothetical protein [Hyphomonadaceae bacterium]